MITAMQARRLNTAVALKEARDCLGGIAPIGLFSKQGTKKIVQALDIIDELFAELVPNKPAHEDVS